MKPWQWKAACFFLFGTAAIGPVAHAQSVVDVFARPDFKSTVLSGVTGYLGSKHFDPKPIDDKFSQAVWKNYLHALDPDHHIFLQDDIKRLQSHQYKIDDQLKEGSSSFFDEVMIVYNARLSELKLLYPLLLANPLVPGSKGVVSIAATKSLPFPATITERTDRWKQLLQLDVLKTCMAIKQQVEQNGKSKQPLTPAMEARARAGVRKKYDRKFSQLLAEKKMAENFYQYVNTVAMEMDPHTVYAVPGENKLFPGSDGRSFYSLGLVLDTDGSDLYIKNVVAGSAADLSGKIFVNDRIIAVEDSTGKMVQVAGMNKLDVSMLISGSKDKKATLLLENEALEERLVSISREEMKELTYKAKSAIVQHNGKKIGYIYLPFFYGSFSLKSDIGSEADLLRELKKLTDQEVQAVILDLRGNPGGSVSEAVFMGGDLFGGGDIALMKGRYKNQVQTNPRMTAVYSGPLTVMVDESSASASEILAGAVQDHGRGIVIGTASSFGKATAQSTFAIGTKEENTKANSYLDYGSLRLTEQKIYRIDGSSNQLRGVIPDIVVQQRMSNTSIIEKDYPNALPADTMMVNNYQPYKRNFNYNLVVKNAQQRINKNNALQLIETNMKKLKQLQSVPYALDWKSFQMQAGNLSLLSSSIQQAKELGAGEQLQVETSFPIWMNPNNILPFENLQYADWINKLKKDRYLLEAVLVAEDLIANPM